MPTPARIRALAAFLAFALGVTLPLAFPHTSATPWFAAALLACAIALLGPGWTARLALIAALSLNAAGLTALRWSAPAPTSLAAALPQSPADPIIITVEGLAETTPARREHRPDSLDRFLPAAQSPLASFRLRVTAAKHQDTFRPATGRLWIAGPADLTETVAAGDTLRLTLLARANPQNLHIHDPLELTSLRRREANTIGSARLPSTDLIEIITPANPLKALRATLTRAQQTLRTQAESLILGEPNAGVTQNGATDRGKAAPGAEPVKTTDSQHATTPRAILAALVLGQPSPELEPARNAFARTRLAHLLAISGFHVAVMAAVALLAVRLTGERGWLEPAIVAVLIALYLVLIPPRTPILRAGILAITLLVSRATGRGHDPIATLAWTAIALLAFNPTELFSLGFQLSFGLVAILILVAERQRADDAELLDQTPEPPLPTVVLKGAAGYARVTLVAWLASAPIVLAHLGYAATYAIAASILAVPFVVAILWLAFPAMLLGTFVPELVELLQPLMHALATALWCLVAKVDTLPGSTIYLPRPSMLWALATAGSVAWIASKGHARRPAVYVLAAVSVAWLAAHLALHRPIPRDTALRIDMLPVADGSCYLIRTKDTTTLWDAGSLAPNPYHLTQTLRHLDVHHIDTAFITHANLDHFNLLPPITQHASLGRLITNATIASNDRPRAAQQLTELLNINPAQANAGDEYQLTNNPRGPTLTILAPEHPEDFIAENDRSLIALIEVPTDAGPAHILLTGDIQQPAIARLLDRLDTLPPIDILEVPHHGSHNPAAHELVERLSPTIVLQSTGPQRANDPRWAPLRANRVWPTTAREGHTALHITNTGQVTVQTSK